MIKSNSIRPDVPNKFYNEKKPLFSSKEIIFRSQGCAKVFHISSRAQVVFLAAVLCVACWSFYSYHMYHKSDVLIHSQNLELVETRDAYVDLMTDFMTLHKNIGAMLNSIDSEKQRDKKSLEKYRRQAQIVEEKIKQITSKKDWVSDKKVNEKTSIREALLQRDIAASERDELKKQMEQMEATIDELKTAELEVLDKIKTLSNKELDKIKGIFSSVNVALKRKNMYFNAMANSKRKDSKGGPYVPLKIKLDDPRIEDKVSAIFKSVDDIEYYREVMLSVPLGKPVWRSLPVTVPAPTRLRKPKPAIRGLIWPAVPETRLMLRGRARLSVPNMPGLTVIWLSLITATVSRPNTPI